MAENGKAKYYALMEEMKTDILSGKIRPGEKTCIIASMSSQFICLS